MTSSPDAESSGTAKEAQRQRSSISFPYMDMKAAITLAEAIQNNVGGRGECDDTQLAAWSGQSAKSSTFRVQVYAARIFGILEGESGRHRLTETGRLIVDPVRQREGKVRAFLSVPLYKALFENNNGTLLPPSAALEREIVSLGVSEKQKDRARQVFERSAEQAGFFEHGKNRLVKPGIAQMDGTSLERERVRERLDQPNGEDVADGGSVDRRGGGGSGPGGGKPPYHPLIAGLFETLPAPGSWTDDEAADWLQAAAVNFKIVYKLKGKITVSLDKGVLS